ncbi:hypothetical protein V8J88_14940 [Massilia sp. W12]|uniref:LIC_13387 family protein n=1 Tax=Massilia sp. W12 TaxID=3126507 RepID=UPI0030CC3AB9
MSLSSFAILLMAGAAAIIGLLGALHLWLTLRGRAFEPRDPAVLQAMRATPPQVARATSMWRAWVGFNHSHSLGALLFAALYLWLAVVSPGLWLSSWFLRLLGVVCLLSWLCLARLYWFKIPLRGIALASLLYLAALGCSLW